MSHHADVFMDNFGQYVVPYCIIAGINFIFVALSSDDDKTVSEIIATSMFWPLYYLVVCVGVLVKYCREDN